MRLILIGFLLAFNAANAEFGIGGGVFDNTPFDPDTWHKTTENTPLDPRTWQKTAQDIADPLGTLCTKYLDHKRQGQVSFRSLTHAQKFYLRPHFKDLVDRVTVFYNARLNGGFSVGNWNIAVSSAAQTIGYTIYIAAPQRADDDTEQLLLLAHEMAHVWQYDKYGGNLRQFCRVYMDGYVKHGFDYAANPMEHGAFSFEASYAAWLGQNHPNPAWTSYQHSTGSKYVRRNPPVPGRLVIPPQQFLTTCVENRNPTPVRYSIQWAGSPAQPITIQPNQSLVHSIALAGGMFTGPAFNVMYGFNRLDGSVDNRNYGMRHLVSNGKFCSPASTYYFLWRNNDLGLYSVQ